MSDHHTYAHQLERLQIGLSRVQRHILANGHKVLIIIISRPCRKSTAGGSCACESARKP